MNTLEAIFSFVFGDGDQNGAWTTQGTIGNVIRNSRGVVTRRLAPFDRRGQGGGPKQPARYQSSSSPRSTIRRPREVDKRALCAYRSCRAAAAGSRSAKTAPGYLQERVVPHQRLCGAEGRGCGPRDRERRWNCQLHQHLANSALSASQIAQTYGGVVSSRSACCRTSRSTRLVFSPSQW